MRWHRLKPAMLAAPAGSDFVARTNPPMVEAWACPTVAACCHTVAGSSRLLWRQPRAALVAKVHVVALRNFSQLEISFQQTASHHSSNNKASFNLCIGAIGSVLQSYCSSHGTSRQNDKYAGLHACPIQLKSFTACSQRKHCVHCRPLGHQHACATDPREGDDSCYLMSDTCFYVHYINSYDTTDLAIGLEYHQTDEAPSDHSTFAVCTSVSGQ